MQITQDLREQHSEIMQHFNEIAKLVNKGTDDEFLDTMIQLKNILISHLNVEDKLIYPKFAKSKSIEIKKLGEMFSQEMISKTPAVLEFFAKYEREPIVSLKKDKDFKKTLKNLIIIISARIKIEEEILFPVFENLK